MTAIPARGTFIIWNTLSGPLPIDTMRAGKTIPICIFRSWILTRVSHCPTSSSLADHRLRCCVVNVGMHGPGTLSSSCTVSAVSHILSSIITSDLDAMAHLLKM